MGNLTDKETAVLKAIDDSEYGDYLTDAVWTFTIADNIEGGIEETSLPGIMSSLNKKGYVVSGGEGHDATVRITDDGARAYTEVVGRDNVAKAAD